MSRCLIYKVHAALPQRLLMIAHRLYFVKNFFQVFQLFRSLIRRSGGLSRRSRKRLAYFTTSPPFCQHLFSSFFEIFSFHENAPFLGFCHPYRGSGGRFPSAAAYYYIVYSLGSVLFVKHTPCIHSCRWQNSSPVLVIFPLVYPGPSCIME